MPEPKICRCWWWNPDESGSGYSVEVQGNNLFVVGFMYDDSGRAVWYYSAGPMSFETTYHGDVLQFANGQTMGGPYQPPGMPVATLDIQFADVTHATFMFTEAAASTGRVQKAAGRTRSDSLQARPAISVRLPDQLYGHFFDRE